MLALPATNEYTFSRNEIKNVQRTLSSMGFNTHGIDGMIGAMTRDAIKAYQKASNLPQDGHLSTKILNQLKKIGRW